MVVSTPKADNSELLEMSLLEENRGAILYSGSDSPRTIPVSFDGHEFTISETRAHSVAFEQTRRLLNTATRFSPRKLLRSLFSWPLPNVFHDALIPDAELTVPSDRNANFEVGTRNLLQAQPESVSASNIDSKMTNSTIMQRFPEINHVREELDVLPLQDKLNTDLNLILSNSRNSSALRDLGAGFLLDSVSETLQDTANAFFNKYEERLQPVIKSTIMKPAVKFIKGIADLFYHRVHRLDVTGGTDCQRVLNFPNSAQYASDTGMARFSADLGVWLLSFFIEVKPYTKKIGWGYSFYMHCDDNAYLPPDLLYAVDPGSPTYLNLKNKCIKNYLLAFKQIYIYALLFGVKYFSLSDYSCHIFYKVERENPEASGRDQLRVLSRYTSYTDTGIKSTRNILASVLWATIPDLDNGQEENQQENWVFVTQWCYGMLRHLHLSEEEVDDSMRSDREQLGNIDSIRDSAPVEDVRETMTKNYKKAAFRELLYNVVEDIRVGSNYITQTFRVRSAIISDHLLQDDTFIFKLFAYMSCDDKFDHFELAGRDEIKQVEQTHHLAEIRAYVTLQHLQGGCIPRMVEYGSMFDFSKEHEFSLMQGRYVLIQDVGDVEPDPARLQHYNLALSALKRIHAGRIVHRDLHLRNMRLFEDKVFIFDFNVSRLARGDNDFQKDLDDLKKVFAEALNVDGMQNGHSTENGSRQNGF